MRSPRISLIALLLMLVAAAAGCANPADGKPEAEVAAPIADTAAADEAAAGEVLVVGEGSSITWVGSKVTGSHDGGFNEFDGEIVVVDDDPTRSSVNVSIDTTSIWSDNERLTGHLKSEDFFEVETYPTATFESTSIEAAEDGYMVTGNLTLHGVTKSVRFPAQIALTEAGATATAEFSIKRFDWDIVYKGKADDLIRDEVVIRFDLNASRPAA